MNCIGEKCLRKWINDGVNSNCYDNWNRPSSHFWGVQKRLDLERPAVGLISSDYANEYSELCRTWRWIAGKFAFDFETIETLIDFIRSVRSAQWHFPANWHRCAVVDQWKPLEQLSVWFMWLGLQCWNSMDGWMETVWIITTDALNLHSILIIKDRWWKCTDRDTLKRLGKLIQWMKSAH